LSAQPFLAASESTWLLRNVDEAIADVETKKVAITDLDAEIAAAAEQARHNASQLAAAAGHEITPEQLDEAASNATAYGRERREVLLRQLGEKYDKQRLAERDDAKWREQLKLAEGSTQHVPVLPVGDSLLEPFWCATAVRTARTHTSGVSARTSTASARSRQHERGVQCRAHAAVMPQWQH
jgi:hypothetical protein